MESAKVPIWQIFFFFSFHPTLLYIFSLFPLTHFPKFLIKLWSHLIQPLKIASLFCFWSYCWKIGNWCHSHAVNHTLRKAIKPKRLPTSWLRFDLFHHAVNQSSDTIQVKVFIFTDRIPALLKNACRNALENPVCICRWILVAFLGNQRWPAQEFHYLHLYSPILDKETVVPSEGILITPGEDALGAFPLSSNLILKVAVQDQVLTRSQGWHEVEGQCPSKECHGGTVPSPEMPYMHTLMMLMSKTNHFWWSRSAQEMVFRGQ